MSAPTKPGGIGSRPTIAPTKPGGIGSRPTIAPTKPGGIGSRPTGPGPEAPGASVRADIRLELHPGPPDPRPGAPQSHPEGPDPDPGPPDVELETVAVHSAQAPPDTRPRAPRDRLKPPGGHPGLPDARAGPASPARGRTARRLGGVRATVVQADGEGAPLRIDRHTVATVRESWLIEDRWWTDQPLHRRYWEVVSDAGRDIVVFHDLLAGGWYRQR